MNKKSYLCALMRKTLVWLLFSAIVFSTACKSEFERVRTSGDPEAILNKAFGYYERKQYQRAQTLFDLVLTTLRGDARAEKAYFQYAYTHYHLKNYLLAAYYFKNFSNTFLNSDFREEAAYMSAYSNYLLSPSYKLEQSSTQAAIDEFQLFTNLFPTSSRVGECNKLIDELRRKMEEKAFAEGQLYYNLRQYQSAVISFDNLLKDYPETPDAERVRYLIAKSAHLLSENSIVEKKEERYQEAIQRCNDFLEKYPQGEYAKAVKSILKDSEKGKSEIAKKLKS